MCTRTWAQAQESRPERLLPDHLESALGDIDSETHRIFAAHFFGIAAERSPTLANGNEAPGLRHIGPIAAEIVSEIRFRRKVEQVHSLGPRVTAELLAEIGAERSIRTVIDQKLEVYAGLDPSAVSAVGGDRFWPAPVHRIKP